MEWSGAGAARGADGTAAGDSGSSAGMDGHAEGHDLTGPERAPPSGVTVRRAIGVRAVRPVSVAPPGRRAIRPHRITS